MQRLERWGWWIGAALLCLLGVPWFLWGDSTIVLGLPLWIWWHVGWLLFTSLLFWIFTQRYWGIGVEPGGSAAATARTTDDRQADTGDGQ